MTAPTGGAFRGRVVLVTGGGSGIGRAAAEAFARESARVAVADLRGEAAAVTAERIRAAGGDALALTVDVTSADDTERMVRATVDAYGGLDAAVNSAGIGGVSARTAAYPPEVWDRVLAVNLTGVWLSMRAELPAMLEGGGGAIVNVASVAGLVGFRDHAAYAASKHGVIGLTRSAALEYARRGIRVNAVCPAFTSTPMVDSLTGLDPEAERRLADGLPIGRLGTPEEIAASILHLCSDAAGFTTGHALALDGGLTAG